MESTNLTTSCERRGLPTANKTIKLFDESVSVGGPIKRDKLWFFVAPRSWGLVAQPGRHLLEQDAERVPDAAGRRVQVVLWTPWVDRPEDRLSGRLEWYDSVLTRITWQATPKNKFNFTYDEQRACNCGSVSAAPVARVVRLVVSLRAESAAPGDLELADHQPAAARSRRRRDDLAVEHVL